jgi:hypothetical protein
MSFSNTPLGGRRWRCPLPAEWWRGRRHRPRHPSDGQPTLAQVVEVGNLLWVYDDLRAHAGQAPGADGLTYGDYARREVVEALHAVRKAALAGRYRPHPARELPIPKASGGHRTLRIPEVMDRVVSPALHRALTPVWEAVFLNGSHGFRPRRSVWTLLAGLQTAAEHDDHPVVVEDDVEKAFDRVQVEPLIDLHRGHVVDHALMGLVEAIFRGPDGRRTVGIDQGAAYSPTALNVYLHHAHDVAFERVRPKPHWWRFADNHAYLCQSVTEGSQVRSRCQQLLQPGMNLKGGINHHPNDLNANEEVHLLGYVIARKRNRMTYAMGEDSWAALETKLTEAHHTNNPPRSAHQCLQGWLEWCGPTLETGRMPSFTQRVIQVTARYGFGEISSLDTILQTWTSSWRRWLACLRRARDRHE